MAANGLGFNLSIPPAEAPDEPSHWQYVYFLRERRALPFLSPPGGGGISQGAHPPLYYGIAALLTARLPNRAPTLIENPFFSYNLERPLIPNVYLHAHEPPFPYRTAPAILAVHIMRLVSLAAMLALVAASYRLAALVWPDEPAIWLATAAVVAGLPGALFLAGVFNNELLASALAAWALVGAVRLAGGEANRRQLVGVGVLLALALLAKMSTLVLVVVASLAALIHLWRFRRWQIVPRLLTLTGLPLLALTAPWFWHNSRVYGAGDLTGWQAFASAAPELERRLPLTVELRTYWQQQFVTFWGAFGWNTVRLPPALYRLYGILSLLAIVGLLRLACRARSLPANSRWALVLVGTACALGYALVFSLAFRFGLVIAQGRYLYPFLAAFAVLWVSGLATLMPVRVRPAGLIVLGLVSLAIGTYSLLAVARPAFAVPQPVSERELREATGAADALFDGRLRLRGCRFSPQQPRAGEPWRVSLYWEVIRHAGPLQGGLEKADIGFVHLVGADGEVVARLDAMPFAGRLPTSAWTPGAVYRLDYDLAVSATGPVGAGVLLVGWYPDGQPERRLPVSRDGQPIGDVLRIEPIMVQPGSGAD